MMMTNEYVTGTELEEMNRYDVQAVALPQSRDGRSAMAGGALRGFALGLVVGLVLSLAVSVFTSYQPAAGTSLLSVLTAGLYGAYLGTIYSTQPGDSDYAK